MSKVEKAIEQNKPDWSIGELYKNAWEIVKNNKILWIFGMATAAGGFSGNSSRSLDQKDFEGLQKIFNSTPKDSSSKVLGTATNSLTDTISLLFSNIPTSYYIAIGIELIIFLIIALIISVVYKSWAQAALLEGIQSSINKNTLSIKELSEKAFGSVKSIILIQLVPLILLLLTSISLILIIIYGSFNIPNSAKSSLLLFVPIFLIVFITAIIYINLTIIWAIRIAVIDKKPARAALNIGYKIAKKKFWASVLLGLVNVISEGIVYAIILLPSIALVVGGIYGISKNTYWSIGIITTGFILFMVFIFALSILSGVITAFKTTVWSLAYNAIKGKYEK